MKNKQSFDTRYLNVIEAIGSLLAAIFFVAAVSVLLTIIERLN